MWRLTFAPPTSQLCLPPQRIQPVRLQFQSRLVCQKRLCRLVHLQKHLAEHLPRRSREDVCVVHRMVAIKTRNPAQAGYGLPMLSLRKEV